ncbi:DUF3800 domain-containing protein [Clostridium tertium]|uniref:DUF3800 domain-containing protein n=1 Tax=Clostridium tertium TaxID=1559 RepID=UPI00291B6E9D|nr:DUF3800 domain-containing protein [Clostridium sp.]
MECRNIDIETREICIDESGNTGPNYLDKNEQYFILAGWLDVNNEMQKAENVEFLTDLLGKKEGKSYNLVNSVNGKERMLSVLTFMKEKKCVPIIAIANKKYCIPMRIVEVLLDPVYNDKIFSEFEEPEYYYLKKQYADILFKHLSDEELKKFANIYRGKGISNDERVNKMRSFIDEISNSLSKKDIALARLIKGSKKKIKLNIENEDENKSEIGAKQSPNLWLLYMFLLLVEKNCSKYGYKIQVIHDEQKKYESHIQDMLLFVKKHKELFQVELNYINEIRFSNSENKVMIQAADILAGSVNMILKRKNINWKADISFVNILNIVIPYISDFGTKDSNTVYVENYEVYSNIMKFYEKPIYEC